VDPGTAITGYGVVDGGGGSTAHLVECGAIRPRRRAPLPLRLADIHRGLLEVIERLRPDCLAVEGVFVSENHRTAVVLGHARGVVLLAGALSDLEVAEYSPAAIKKSVVGAGRATKAQVGYMVQRHLGLAAPPAPADAADGCAVALCHLFSGLGAGALIRPTS